MEKAPQGPGAKIERITFEFGSATQKGEKYENNNDDHFILQAANAGGVFDGVGSKGKGREAAQIAKKAAMQEMIKISDISARDKAEEVLRAANEAILEARKNDSSLNGMATTGTIAIVRSESDSAFAAAGDTRAYILNANCELEQLTKDEVSWINKNNLTNWLGDEEFIPQSGTFAMQKEDILLILSDGIYKMLSDNDIAEIASTANSPQEVAEELIHEAAKNEQEHSDDKTAVVIFAK